jgi:hypothetical protein
MNWYRIISAFVIACLLSSCAALKPTRDLTVIPVERTAQVRNLLSNLKTQNEALVNFKGIGNITIRQNGLTQFDQRVAWIGERPVKFSIAVLISGYPAVKLAADGRWLYYLEVQGQESRFRKMATSDPDLEKLIWIPISISDVIVLLSGRIPLPEFDSIEFIQETSKQQFALVLTDSWWGIQQKIFYDATLSQIQKVEVYHRSGSLRYRAEVQGTRQVDGYKVPQRLKLSNDDGIDFLLDIHRYWVNVEVPPEVFVLTPPK